MPSASPNADADRTGHSFCTLKHDSVSGHEAVGGRGAKWVARLERTRHSFVERDAFGARHARVRRPSLSNRQKRTLHKTPPAALIKPPPHSYESPLSRALCSSTNFPGNHVLFKLCLTAFRLVVGPLRASLFARCRWFCGAEWHYGQKAV